MKLRRQDQPPAGRQRLRSDDLQPQTVPYAYHGSKIDRNKLKQTGQKYGSYWLQRFGLAILLLVALFSAVNVLSLSNDAKVLPLSNTGDKTFLRGESVYENAANKILASSIWSRNKVTVDTGRVKRDMLRQFPELTSVSVAIPLLAHRPIIYVQPAEPALILVAANGSFIVDTNGKALIRAESPKELNQPGLAVLTDQSGLKVHLNGQALPAGDVKFMRVVGTQLAAKRLHIASMVLPAGTSELDVKITGEPYLIKFNLQSDKAREEAGTFLATKAYLDKHGTTPSQYIDVRVDGRAYYK